MICPKCGYILEDLDESCRRCGGMGVCAQQKTPVQPSHWPVYWAYLKRSALCLAVCLVAGALVLIPLSKSYSLAHSDNIQEAVLRHALQYHQPRSVFFVWIEGLDPTDEFLTRLSDIPHLLRKGSESKLIPTRDMSGGYYVDKLTNERGRDISIGSVRWLSLYKAEVSYDDRIMGRKCLVVKQQNGWIVQHSEMEWVV
jgi:hypothetical protein